MFFESCHPLALASTFAKIGAVKYLFYSLLEEAEFLFVLEPLKYPDTYSHKH